MLESENWRLLSEYLVKNSCIMYSMSEGESEGEVMRERETERGKERGKKGGREGGRDRRCELTNVLQLRNKCTHPFHKHTQSLLTVCL